MRKISVILAFLVFASASHAGFKVKLVKPKKPEKFQASTTVAGVTFAADLLLDGDAQKDFFYKELTPSHIIAVRLAVFNRSREEVVLPIEGFQLTGPDGKQLALLTPDTVAHAILQGLVVSEEPKDDRTVAVSPNVRYGDPRYDRTDPRYDPRLDPSDPSYDPNDPRNRGYGRNRGYDRYPRPGVDVVLNPGGGRGGGGDLSQFEKKLVEKDFDDKAHASTPVHASLSRDRFLYFSINQPASDTKGFALRIPPGKGIPQEIILKF